MEFKQINWGIGVLFAALTLLFTTSCNEDFDMDDPEYERGDTIWMHDMLGRDSFLMEPVIAIDESRRQLYYAKSGGTLYWTPARIVAVSLDDGQMLWESPSLGGISTSSEIVVGDDGTVYATSATKLFAIDPSSGNFKWEWQVPEKVNNPNGSGDLFTFSDVYNLTLAGDGNLILATGVIGGVYNRALYSVSPSGSRNWVNIEAVHVGIHGDDIVIDNNDRCYYFTDQYVNDVWGRYLMGVNLQNGSILWRTQVGAIGSSNNNIIFDNQGNLVISVPLILGDPYLMHTINPANGNIILSSSENADDGTKIIDGNGRIYQQLNEGIYTYDQNTLQRSEVPGLNASLKGAFLNANNQLVLIGGDNLKVYNSNGALAWDVEFNGMDHRLLALSSKGVVYAIVSGKGVVAIQAESHLSSSNWPKRTHDNRNTNNLSK